MRVPFSEVFDDITRLGKKISCDHYLHNGNTPIIDQGKEFISGYSNEEIGIIKDLPAIVFGDHTRILKYIDFPFLLGADGVKVLSCKRTDFIIKYLYYNLCAIQIPNTGYNRHFKWLKTLHFDLIPLWKQKETVNILDQIVELIEKRNQQLEKLDMLVISKFNLMFGDLKNNFPLVSLKDVFKIRDDLRKPINYAERSEMRTGALYPYYGANGQIDSVNDYLMDGEAICLAEDCGAYGAGEPSSYIVTGKCWVNNHAHVLFPRECCNIKFANVYFKIIDLSEYVTGTTRLKLTQEKMKKIPILLPPIELQNEFARFVEKTEQVKSKIKRSLEKLETLKKALMQEYFG